MQCAVYSCYKCEHRWPWPPVTLIDTPLLHCMSRNPFASVCWPFIDSSCTFSFCLCCQWISCCFHRRLNSLFFLHQSLKPLRPHWHFWKSVPTFDVCCHSFAQQLTPNLRSTAVSEILMRALSSAFCTSSFSFGILTSWHCETVYYRYTTRYHLKLLYAQLKHFVWIPVVFYVVKI